MKWIGTVVGATGFIAGGALIYQSIKKLKKRKKKKLKEVAYELWKPAVVIAGSAAAIALDQSSIKRAAY